MGKGEVRLDCGIQGSSLGGGRLPPTPRTPLFTHKNRPSSERAKGQMFSEDVQWEGIYANISLSLKLGILNIV